METDQTDRERQRTVTETDPRLENGHELLRVTERLPGREPTEYDIELTEGPPYSYTTTYWRCRRCGQERNHREEFREPCPVERRPHPVTDGGYSIEEPRTRRALSEAIEVRFGEQGPRYLVESATGNTYEVDLAAEECTCPDARHRDPAGGCKHLRRVDIEVRTGTVPAPDGRFLR
ncbi:hypothetical protein [Haloparvum sedimenti]|uniref:hypothetical protein n=1 Tax=Haloparvum sedimenti TaxID=1678448 RepID=UPI00071E8670|nr:hypothetical protein [Haloparvum sedimenti]